MQIKVYSNIADGIRGMNDLERSQFPFAVSKAMNETAFEVRRHTVGLWSKSVTQRNKRFAAAAMRVSKKATKATLEVEITDVLRRDAFERQAQGETRRPVSGRNLAVPKIGRLATGRIAAGNRPKAILSKDGYFKNRKGNAILRRMRNGRLKLIYLLIPSARVAKRFPAYEEAEKAWDRVMPFAFDKAMNDAMNTAFGGLTMKPL